MYNFIMSDSPFQRISEFLRDNPSIDFLGRSSAPQPVNHDLWREVAGNKIAEHTRVRLDGRELVIYTDSPVWAHAVNQQRITLLEAMRKRGVILDSARIRHQPPEPNRTVIPMPAKPTPIPAEASRALKQTAETIDDEALCLALLRLSRHSVNAAN
jgi:hypothetical protein